ncbi:MAG: TonB family protein [Candidatus Acidiferrales bacterium]
MLTRLRDTGLALLLSISAVGVLPHRAMAQDAAQQTESKRKVKKEVQPTYPDIAKRINLTGKVKLQVVVNTAGHVTSTKVLGGNPVLANAAEQAAKAWAWEPSPSETTELVEFDFTGASN